MRTKIKRLRFLSWKKLAALFATIPALTIIYATHGFAVQPGKWSTQPGGAAICQALALVVDSRVCTYDTTDLTSSDPLLVGNCGSVSVILNPDWAGTGTGCTGYVLTCGYKDTAIDQCQPFTWDRTGDGINDDGLLDGASPGQVGASNIKAEWIRILLETNTTGQCRWRAECHLQ